MFTAILPLAALGSLLFTTPALADRAGDAPIKAPTSSQTDHVVFTLKGDTWKQRLGTLEGTPALGTYELEDGAGCSLSAKVVGRASTRPPIVRGRTVRLRPSSPSTDVLRPGRRGRNGPVRWWAGTLRSSPGSDSVPGAGGVQRLPARLVKNDRRYLVYRVSVTPSSTTAQGSATCAALARRTSLGIARTMHVADGPPVSAPPFIS